MTTLNYIDFVPSTTALAFGWVLAALFALLVLTFFAIHLSAIFKATEDNSFPQITSAQTTKMIPVLFVLGLALMASPFIMSQATEVQREASLSFVRVETTVQSTGTTTAGDGKEHLTITNERGESYVYFGDTPQPGDKLEVIATVIDTDIHNSDDEILPSTALFPATEDGMRKALPSWYKHVTGEITHVHPHAQFTDPTEE